MSHQLILVPACTKFHENFMSKSRIISHGNNQNLNLQMLKLNFKWKEYKVHRNLTTVVLHILI